VQLNRRTNDLAGITTVKASKSHLDWIAMAVAILSLVVSVLSWELSNEALSEQKRQFQEVQTERLGVTLTELPYDPVRVTKIDYGAQGRVLMTPWRLILSNTGQQRISIVAYQLKEGDTPKTRVYTGLDGGIYDADRKRIDPSDSPISLEPGESKVFRLEIGILVPPKVSDALALGARNGDGWIANPSLTLAKAGFDLYGNPVELKQDPSGFYLIQYSVTESPSPKYTVEIVTSRQGVFAASATPSAVASAIGALDANEARRHD